MVRPYVRHNREEKLAGVQVFKRADLVYTVYEIKFTEGVVPLSVGEKFGEKLLQIPELRDKNIQRALITRSQPRKELVSRAKFSQIVTVDKLLTLNPY